MIKKFLSRNFQFIIHIAIWGLLFLLPHLFIDTRTAPSGFFPGSWFWATNIYNVGLFYLNTLVLYSLFFNKRKWWLWIVSIALLMIVSYYLKLWFTKEFYPEVILDDWSQRIMFFPLIAFFAASTIYRLIVDRIKYDKKQKEIIAEQLSVKLKFLRSQISPHFIFNVLTNLVSLARKGSKQLEPALLMLSDLMRYMLYESDEKKVLLSTEIEYVKSYINLQQLRFGEDVKINLQIELSEEMLKKNIEPMLLIPFVENAFKHGTGSDQPFIDIHLYSKNDVLELEVRNKLSDEDASKDFSSGIGLENVQTRLELLYQKKYSLMIHKENNIFHVHLTLQLNT